MKRRNGTAVKICFVIMAHHQPGLLARLVAAIAAENRDVVIHLDKRCDIKAFPGLEHPKVHLVPGRRRVNWAGWSQAAAILDGLSHGLAASDADYFMFLAGTDFPIRPLRELEDFLAAQGSRNFLNYLPLVPGTWAYGLVDRFRFNDFKSRFIDIKIPDDRSTPAWWRLAGRLVSRAEAVLNAHFMPRRTGFMHLYGGSSRWCLHRDTVRHVVEYAAAPESRTLRTFLRSCANADEIFIQTAILNSRFKEQCVGFDEGVAEEIFAGRRPPMADENRVYLHYIDWNPTREDPAVLTLDDLPALQASGKYFASKFLEPRSTSLVDAIERDILPQY
jgi:hypothetical protein